MRKNRTSEDAWKIKKRIQTGTEEKNSTSKEKWPKKNTKKKIPHPSHATFLLVCPLFLPSPSFLRTCISQSFPVDTHPTHPPRKHRRNADGLVAIFPLFRYKHGGFFAGDKRKRIFHFYHFERLWERDGVITLKESSYCSLEMSCITCLFFWF